MKRPGMLPNGEAGILWGVDVLRGGDEVRLCGEGWFDGSASTNPAAEGLGIAAAAAAGEDDLFFKSWIRFLIASVALAFFSASVGCWALFPDVATCGIAVAWEVVGVEGGVALVPACLLFLAACSRLRYSARFAGAGEGTDFAGGMPVLSAGADFEPFVVASLGRAIPASPFPKEVCAPELVLGAEGIGSGSEGKFKLR